MLFAPAAVYRPGNPKSSDYNRCVEDRFETFVQVYEERLERPYGFWRPYLQKVIYRYMECRDLHHGFARVKCRYCHRQRALFPALSGALQEGLPQVFCWCPARGEDEKISDNSGTFSFSSRLPFQIGIRGIKPIISQRRKDLIASGRPSRR